MKGKYPSQSQNCRWVKRITTLLVNTLRDTLFDITCSSRLFACNDVRCEHAWSLDKITYMQIVAILYCRTITEDLGEIVSRAIYTFTTMMSRVVFVIDFICCYFICFVLYLTTSNIELNLMTSKIQLNLPSSHSNLSHTNMFQATSTFLLLTNHDYHFTLKPISSSSQNDFISVTYFLIPSPDFLIQWWQLFDYQLSQMRYVRYP